LKLFIEAIIKFHKPLTSIYYRLKLKITITFCINSSFLSDKAFLWINNSNHPILNILLPEEVIVGSLFSFFENTTILTATGTFPLSLAFNQSTVITGSQTFILTWNDKLELAGLFFGYHLVISFVLLF
jgi:hypothetical protein